MKLRSRLFLLVAGTVVPLVALAVILGILLVDHERETFRSGLIARNRAFMSAVDAELRGHVTTLMAMAASANLATGNVPAYREEAARVVKTQHDWLDTLISTPDGTVLADARMSAGAALPVDVDRDSLVRAVSSRVAVAGGVVYRDYLRAYGIALRFPVIQKGEVAYVLTAVIDPLQFQRVIEAQHLANDWVSGLVDANGHFVARIPTRSHGDFASDEFVAAVHREPEGWYRGLTIEGVDAFTAHATSAATGWSIGLAIPTSVVYSSANRAIWGLALGTLAAIFLAVAFAYWMSRRIEVPIAGLASAARALGEDAQPVSIPLAGTIEEVDVVVSALNGAAIAIHEREALLMREQVALRAADRAKDEFLAMLGHELRNPLSAITTSVQVLRAAPEGSPMQSKARAIIERQSRQMTRLIEDLLDITRLTMGMVKLHPEAFDMAVLVRNLVQTWEQSGRIQAGRVVVNLEPAWVEGDRARLEQVIANLLDNATKFTPADKSIFVNVIPDDGWALVEVADEGEGIPPELLDQVFKLFVQAPQGPDRASGGLGLGLAVVRRLVEMHGGNVTATSAGLGTGSTFTVRIPLGVEPNADAASDSAAAAARPVRILVVEDNPDGREMLQAVLGLNGHQVRAVGTGSEALVESHRSPPDLVLLDIGLPDIDGYEVARRMRAQPRTASLRIVAITGYGQAEDERRAYEVGMDAHVTKPVEPEELLELVARLLGEVPTRPRS